MSDPTRLPEYVVKDKFGLPEFKKSFDTSKYFDLTPQVDLYHYTSAEGLKGILQSQSFWLTNIRYFNDAQELKYADKLIRRIMNERKSKSSLNYFYDLLLKHFNFYDQYFTPYISCFSEMGNLLNQYRNYGMYSIGFDPVNQLRTRRHHSISPGWQPAVFRKVIYDSGIQTFIINNFLERIENKYLAVVQEEGIGHDYMIVQEFIILTQNILVDCLISFKHEAFMEEQEWRLIYVRKDDEKRTKLMFRTVNDHLVPYVEMPICKVDDASLNLWMNNELEDKGHWVQKDFEGFVEAEKITPIGSINIGPLEQSNLIQKSIRMLCENLNLKEIEVRTADYILRNGW